MLCLMSWDEDVDGGDSQRDSSTIAVEQWTEECERNDSS